MSNQEAAIAELKALWAGRDRPATWKEIEELWVDAERLGIKFPLLFSAQVLTWLQSLVWEFPNE